MNKKIVILKMLWRVITKSNHGVILLQIDNKQQLNILNRKESDIRISYVGVDKRVALKILERIESTIN